VYIQRDWKYSDFSGAQERGEPCVEDWIASMKSGLRVGPVPEEDQVELLKQHLKGEAKLTVRFMLEGVVANVQGVFRVLEETYRDTAPIGTCVKEFYVRCQAPWEEI